MNVLSVVKYIGIISALLNYIANSYIPRQEQQLIRSILSNKNTPLNIKKQTQKLVSYHYIPFALKESKQFSQRHNIPISLYKDVNAIALEGLVKGISKYDWSVKYSNIHLYLKKYILGELYHSHILYNYIYDNNRLEWLIVDDRTIIPASNSPTSTRHMDGPDTQYFTYYRHIYDTILLATEKLTPYEKRFFFVVYDRNTLKRNKYTVAQQCELLGVSNPETYRYHLISIVEKLKNYIKIEKDHYATSDENRKQDL